MCYEGRNFEIHFYRYYREQGWMIGSGAMESTHRTLLQVRMKRSGQRWANDSCANMIILRLSCKNHQSDIIRDHFEKVA